MQSSRPIKRGQIEDYISTSTQNALNLKANILNPSFSGTVKLLSNPVNSLLFLGPTSAITSLAVGTNNVLTKWNTSGTISNSNITDTGALISMATSINVTGSIIKAGGNANQFLMADGSVTNIAGTTNFIPKFASANTFANSRIIDNGTYLGIELFNAPTRDLALGRYRDKIIGVEEGQPSFNGAGLTVEAGKATNTIQTTNFENTQLVSTSFQWFGVAIGSGSSGDVYATTNGASIWKQSGGTGTMVDLGQTSRQWRGISIASNGDVYAVVLGGDIYKQTGGIGTFNALGQIARNWYGITCHPNTNVYASVFGGDIYMQTGGIGTFNILSAGTRNWRQIITAPNGDVYACVENGDIYKQTGGTGSFSALTTLGYTGSVGTWEGIVITPNGDIYAASDPGTDGGIYRALNGSLTFTLYPNTKNTTLTIGYWRDMAYRANGDVLVGSSTFSATRIPGIFSLANSSSGLTNLNGGTLKLTSGTGKGSGASNVEIWTGQLSLSGTDLQVLTKRVTIDNIGSSTFYNNVSVSGSVVATSFIKTGGTSTQFLMADGSVTTGPISGITGTGTTNTIPKFTSTGGTLGDSNFKDVGGVGSYNNVSQNSSVSFLFGGASWLRLSRSQAQTDFNVGNPQVSQSFDITSNNTYGATYKSAGFLTLNAGTAYTEGLRVISGGFIQFTQAPTASTTTDFVLTRNSSGLVTQIPQSAFTKFAGTDNFLPKFSGNSLINSSLFDNGGNVGINTTVNTGATLNIKTTGSSFINMYSPSDVLMATVDSGGSFRTSNRFQIVSGVEIAQAMYFDGVVTVFRPMSNSSETFVFRDNPQSLTTLAILAKSGQTLVNTGSQISLNPVDKLQVNGYVFGSGYKIPSGTSIQFLMADGSTTTATTGGVSVSYWSAGTGINAIVVTGSGSIASGDYSLAEGLQTQAIGVSSHAEGGSTIAFGDYSHAQGGVTIANGGYSHSEGVNTIASGFASHAEGHNSTTYGTASHAEGFNSQANGHYSHSEGKDTQAIGEASHAEGTSTIANNFYAHAEGISSQANGTASHAEGNNTRANGVTSHAEGTNSIATGDYSHAGGLGSQALGTTSFVHGDNSVANNTNVNVLGANITGNTANTTYVDKFNIKTVAVGTTINTLGIDANGNVISSSTPVILGSGTTNVIPKFNSISGLTNSNLSDNGTVISASTDMRINGLTVGRGSGNVISNTVLGNSALLNNTTGSSNTAIGTGAMSPNTIGSENTAIGWGAMGSNINKIRNTVVGAGAGQQMQNGNYNTLVGYSCGSYCNGDLNTAIGGNNFNALTNTATQSFAGGYAALFLNTSGSFNTAVGISSLSENTTGSNNLGLGWGSGALLSDKTNSNQTSNNSIFIGYRTSPLVSGGTNETVIGYDANGLGSNTVVLGNDSVVKTALKGRVVIGTTGDTGERLQVSGSSRFINTVSTATTVLISSNTQNSLVVIGSGNSSTNPIFSVQGSQGELFSVTDSLVGSLFSVNDISGLPVLEVFSDSSILMGNFQAPSLNTTVKTFTNVAGVTNIYSIPISAYTGAFIEYTVNNGANLRAGSFMSVFNTATTQYSETSTNDIGNTSGIILSMVISGASAIYRASGTTSGWTVKSIIRTI